MISIIVSTYKSENFDVFSKNIRETIGVEYEIIAIQNPGIMGLCEAYNKGISIAKYPYICFSHDDIKIKTLNWGEIIINRFEQNKETGIIGVAGEGYKPWVPTGWFFSFLSNSRRINITQITPGESNKVYYNPHNKIFDNVIVVDGCWFCTTSEIAGQFRFDDNTFKGYHYYDIDFSLRVSRKYQVLISYNIDIEHHSYGNYSRDWIIETFRFNNKWKKELPLYYNGMISDEIPNNEFYAFCYILNEISKNETHLWNILNILYSIRLIRLVGFRKWMQLQKYTWTVALKLIKKENKSCYQ